MFLIKKQWQWHGIDSNGNLCSGFIIAHSKKQAYRAIDSNIIIRRIKVSKTNKKISQKLILQFLQQLEQNLSAGLHLQQTLTLLENHASKPDFQRRLRKLKENIVQGHTLSSSLQQYLPELDPIALQFIQCGENTGQLGHAIHDYLLLAHEQQDIKQQCIKALTYPVSVLILSMLITTALLIFIVPSFAQIYHDMGASLPLATQCLISISKQLPFIGTGLLTLSVLIYCVTPKKKRQQLWQSLPIVNTVLSLHNRIIFCQITYALLQASIPLLQACQLAQHSFSIDTLSQAMHKSIQQLASGQSLHQAMHHNPLWDATALQWLASGESSGYLQEAFGHLAKHYQKQLQQKLQLLTQCIEPITMLILASLIGGIMTALYLPIFQLGNIL